MLLPPHPPPPHPTYSQHRAGEDARARLHLRIKKAYQAQLTKAHDHAFSLEQLLIQVEEAQMTASAFQALQLGSRLLKDLQIGIELEDIHKLSADRAGQAAWLHELEVCLYACVCVSEYRSRCVSI